MTMTTIILTGTLVWIPLAVAAALIIGRSVRDADRREQPTVPDDISSLFP